MVESSSKAKLIEGADTQSKRLIDTKHIRLTDSERIECDDFESFKSEIGEQEEANNLLAVSEAEKMAKNFTNFDSKFSTLIDYFSIIGFDNAQLRKLINELIDILNYGEDKTLAFKDKDIPSLAQTHTRADLLRELYGIEHVEMKRRNLDDTVDSVLTDGEEQFGLFRKLKPGILERFPVMNR
jgi:hypothetical protein